MSTQATKCGVSVCVCVCGVERCGRRLCEQKSRCGYGHYSTLELRLGNAQWKEGVVTESG